jgi:hypothetical protein
MDSQTFKQLRAEARRLKIPGYSSMRKAELISALSSHAKPAEPTWNAWLAEKFANPVKKAISTAYNWIGNNVSQPVKKVVDAGFYAFKNKISSIFNNATKPEPEPVYTIRETASALNNVTKQYTIDGRDGVDPQIFMNEVRSQVTDLLSRNRQIKANIDLVCVMERVDMKSGEVTTTEIHYVTKAEEILEATDVNELYTDAIDRILEKIANFQMLGSNWRFKSVVKMHINTFVYKPLKGSSYIPLPKELAAKKAIINMKNEDNECFKWCVTRALNPVERDSERITKILRLQAEKLDWRGIEFPVTLKEINKFERNNTDVSVNVFGYEKKNLSITTSKQEKRKHEVDLLFISNDATNHYCLINNFSRLLSSQVSNKEHKRLFCRRCLSSFDNENSLTSHNKYCSQNEAVRVELPKPGTMLSFKHYNRSMKVPFVVYADFESLIKPIDTCQPDPSMSYTKQYQKHTPSSFSYYIKCFDDDIYPQDTVKFTAESEDDDVAQIFIDMLTQDIKKIYEQFKKRKKRMIFTEADEKIYREATVCHICEQELGDDRVRDHCHLSGKFRGAAHESCNLNYKIPNFFPVVFHNLSGYDSHLFIKKLANGGGKINCIPNNEEKYISFSKEVIVDEYMNDDGKCVKVKRELRFIDSFRFMASSLDALTKNLTKEQCKNIGSKYSGKQLDLLLRKGVYPYDYVDCLAKLEETRLPPKDSFYSKLNDSGITDEDYEHAQTVWKEFGCKTFRDYHDLYNVSDVLLLADVFENFRDVCIKNYKLDPAWYYTSPGLAWDAMLKMTGVKLELLSDYEMLMMVKRGIRGGISTISHRYAHANNKYMGEAYDPSKESSFITYLDANNLYGWAMSKALPTHGFRWMNDSRTSELEKYAVHIRS